MRKYLMGFIVGVALMVGTQAFAESQVGKMVDGEVRIVLNGADLPISAIVVGGTSYAPIRSLAEALRLEVGYADGAVTLTSLLEEATNDVTQMEEVNDNDVIVDLEREQEISELRAELLKLEAAVQRNEADASQMQSEVDGGAGISTSVIDGYREIINDQKARIAEIKQRLAELESE